MTRQPGSKDSLGDLRATFTLRELDRAQRALSGGTVGVFLRVTLAVVFMYLTVVSYLALGITGPVFVSVLFIVALFVPHLYQVLKGWLARHRQTADDAPGELHTESRHGR